MSTIDEAKLSWLKRLGVPDATITILSANRGEGAPNRLNQPGQAAPAEPVGGNADSVPDLINEQGVARGDTKKPVGTGFPAGIPDKDEQDKRDNRNDSGAPKGKMVPVRLPKKSKKQPPKGKALPLRIVLDSGGIKATGPEPKTAVDIQGEIPIESNAKEDLDAILKAIEKEEIKVSIGSVPAKVELRSAERNSKADKRLAIKVWIRTSIPTIERPGKDEIVDAPVVVRIGDISSDGKATIKVHYKPPPSKDAKPRAPIGLEALDVLNRPVGPKGPAK